MIDEAFRWIVYPLPFNPTHENRDSLSGTSFYVRTFYLFMDEELSIIKRLNRVIP